MTGPRLWPDGPVWAGMEAHWYRVRRRPDGLSVMTVIAYPARGELTVASSIGWRVSPRTALALSRCLSAAVERSFPDVSGECLVLEADTGHGWQPA